MDSKSLMIGDLVSLRNKSYKIGALSSHCVVLQGYEPIGLDWNDIEPIPLTPEILEKNGFKNKPHFRTYEKDGVPFFVEIDKAELCLGDCWDDNSIIYACQYVHELQHALRLCGLNELADNFIIQ